MIHRKLSYPLFYGGLLALLLITGLYALPVPSVEAQCGSQASSCKNCHEVQAEMPVNNDGTGWHESHAFGDFCYICHAGNQQATDKAEAHTGMVPPLSDVKASCKMCHADDLDARAGVYASVLGVDLNSDATDSASTTSNTETSTSSSDDFWGGAPANSTPTNDAHPAVVSNDSQDSECIALSQDLVVDDTSTVDYAERYDEIVLGKRPVNMGNIILGVLIGLLVVGGGGFVLLNEIRVNTTLAETRKADGEYPVDVIEMLPALAALKIQTRHALRKILANPQKTEKVLGLIDTVMSDDEPEENK